MVRCLMSYMLDGIQAEPDTALRVHPEIATRVVHIRRQHLQTQGLGLGQQDTHPVLVAHFRGKVSRHELGWIVGFQVSRLVGHEGIGGGVALVKSVLGKASHELKNISSRVLNHTIFAGPFKKVGLHAGHSLRFLFPHGPAQDIGLGQAEPGNGVGNLHHLLLVDNDAIGLIQDWDQGRMQIGDLPAAVLAVDKLVNVRHGTGAVEGVHGDKVFNAGGAQFF
ncbi:hypothetical protein ES703_24572 [subsurface metagenome]